MNGPQRPHKVPNAALKPYNITFCLKDKNNLLKSFGNNGPGCKVQQVGLQTYRCGTDTYGQVWLLYIKVWYCNSVLQQQKYIPIKYKASPDRTHEITYATLRPHNIPFGLNKNSGEVGLETIVTGEQAKHNINI